MLKEEETKLPSSEEMEVEAMPVIVNCVVCEMEAESHRMSGTRHQNKATISLRPINEYSVGMRLDGVLTCLTDSHRWPIRSLAY